MKCRKKIYQSTCIMSLKNYIFYAVSNVTRWSHRSVFRQMVTCHLIRSTCCRLALPSFNLIPLLTNLTPYISKKKNLLKFCLEQIQVEYLCLMSDNVTTCTIGYTIYKLEWTKALQKPKHRASGMNRDNVQMLSHLEYKRSITANQTL